MDHSGPSWARCYVCTIFIQVSSALVCALCVFADVLVSRDDFSRSVTICESSTATAAYEVLSVDSNVKLMYVLATVVRSDSTR